ncbi:MAG: hypothetical protein K6F08_01115 [bacterium]|nr:hypothetical protein [bacterium]
MSYLNKTNDISPKNSSAATGNKFDGNQVFWGNNKITHDCEYKPNSAPNESARVKKTKSLTNMFKTFAVMFSAVLMGSAGLGLITTSSVNVTFNDIYAYDNCVSYYISLSSYEEGLSVVLYNDFTNREEKVEENNIEIEGVFENLAPNMYYTLAVKKGSSTIAKTSIYLKEYERGKYIDYQEEQTKPDKTDDLNERENYMSDDPTYDPTENDNPDQEPIIEDEPNEEPIEENDDPNQSYNSDKPTYDDPTNNNQNGNSNDPTYLDDNENGNPNEP